MSKSTLTSKSFLNPILVSLKKLGGSAHISEIEEQIITDLNLTDNQVNKIHKGSRTKLNYNLAWGRTYLKKVGLIENSAIGVWSLTDLGNKTDIIDENVIFKKVQEQNLINKYGNVKKIIEDEIIEETDWEDDLLEIIKNITPDAFERLCQRLLRELGFVDVNVTGKVGDGGIDGSGIIKINGTLSFHVVFQAKRFNKSVSSSVIRDFRGAMVGRADKGLVLTTGTFTRSAIIEARRDGAPNIDLVDGVDFVRKLKKLKLGVDVETIEKVIINEDWFNQI
ncbi:restriction endonuclease [Ichthyenterobacterium magnum]|uniref:Restriction system protein n=1 Tax=Ichthyenterobacterium magnum TaxID=1230530 RepID=A0A420DL11_9FLAO|nr:restriction endonuclease [Ichthyenterobacterium magnum]RKE94871.1 restriction system protein [Ichthyenterobacterium magnum]